MVSSEASPSNLRSLCDGEYWAATHSADELTRIRGKYDMQDLEEEAILPMLEVHEVYLDKALNTVDSQYGSIEQYLGEAMALTTSDREELRRRYVEGVTGA